MWYQQGDVVIQPERIPQGRRVPAGTVLAKGEATGHAHVLTADSDATLVEVNGVLYLKVGPGGADIQHEEHHSFAAATGRVISWDAAHPTGNEYRIGRVREYDHFAEESRPVRD